MDVRTTVVTLDAVAAGVRALFLQRARARWPKVKEVAEKFGISHRHLEDLIEGDPESRFMLTSLPGGPDRLDDRFVELKEDVDELDFCHTLYAFELLDGSPIELRSTHARFEPGAQYQLLLGGSLSPPGGDLRMPATVLHTSDEAPTTAVCEAGVLFVPAARGMPSWTSAIGEQRFPIVGSASSVLRAAAAFVLAMRHAKMNPRDPEAAEKVRAARNVLDMLLPAKDAASQAYYQELLG
jgi:hypothetical protein